MAKALYIVLQSRGQWWIDLEGRAFGPFANREAARREAIDLAKFLSHTGRSSEVMVPDEEGAYRLVWESARESSLARSVQPPMPSSLRDGPVLPRIRPIGSPAPASATVRMPVLSNLVGLDMSARVAASAAPANRVDVTAGSQHAPMQAAQ
ncbi:hypothetical protein EMQ25_07480 [Arsenicitalea aurantiaca]|uniref:DUF2188 domain-containing protein n=1 Tax=Arsenicitalea aurantiaca TaxID=1783274 RepID=A0A433XFS7_9HYPH|nr:hypothetical protein [Arsenicitalea aurantiaca]RUT32961.1 hypothetical protein EMQ25_07480 [Arsenicitalea aurantiaca]